ncbi:hypothetical protein T10_11206 [Trichinella papuae]|uniref:Uncharacterized protein n=1 Tax=Trichinella papuae TaxID=268474 RepID=A0A0V1M7L8_9BILA|nr:hypothetical protein T10_11206 [Trichinella papuae]
MECLSGESFRKIAENFGLGVTNQLADDDCSIPETVNEEEEKRN